MTTRRLLRLAFACGFAVIVMATVFVGTRPGQRVDDAAFRGRVYRAPEAVERAGDVLQTIEVWSAALAGAALMVVASVRRSLRLLTVVVVVIVGAVVLAEFLKHLVISRPELINTASSVGHNTYPSGHTAVAAALAVGAVLVVPKRWRSTVGIIGALYAATVGAATLTAGAHRPSDAVGALALTVGIGALGGAWLTKQAATEPAGQRVPLAGTGLAMVGALLLALGSIGGAAYILTTKFERLKVVTIGRANAAATGAIAGSALLLFGLLLVALRDETDLGHRHD